MTRDDATREAEFLAAVYAAPDDDGPRGVYADWLVGRGDPRGEFIALQLSKADKSPRALARERSLERKHRASWLGPVWDRVYRVPFRGGDRWYAPTFERGFLAEAVTNFRAGKERVSIGHPAWSTVRTLFASDSLLRPDGGLWVEARAFYLHDVFRGLHQLLNTHPEVAVAFLADPVPRALRRLGVGGVPIDDRDDPWSQRVREAMSNPSSGVPELRQLSLVVHDPRPDRLDWLWRSPLGTRIQQLQLLCATPLDVDGWWTGVPSNVHAVTVLDLHHHATTFERPALSGNERG